MAMFWVNSLVVKGWPPQCLVMSLACRWSAEFKPMLVAKTGITATGPARKITEGPAHNLFFCASSCSHVCCLALSHWAELKAGLALSSLAMALEDWLAHPPRKRVTISNKAGFTQCIKEWRCPWLGWPHYADFPRISLYLHILNSFFESRFFMSRVINFSSGPATLPEAVLRPMTTRCCSCKAGRLPKTRSCQ